MRDRVRGWLRRIANKIKETRPVRWLSRQWDEHPARLAAYILLIVSFLAFLTDFLPCKLAQDFAASFTTEFFGLALTVIIINRLYEGIQDRQLKEQLILQMGSRHNDVTDTAVRTLIARGWLEDGSLKGVNLSGANLEGAVLHRANLQRANLSGANLEGANLFGANLQGADLSYTKLQGAILLGANLEGANLFEANLQGADLSYTKLQGADLSYTKLQGADLSCTKLQGARLRGTTMPDGTKLQGPDNAEAPPYEEWLAMQVDEQAVEGMDEAMSQTIREEE